MTPGSENSIAGFWRALNGAGRAATVLALLTGVGLLIPGPPFHLLRGEGPAIPHYLALSILLMLDVPLAWTAWKVQVRRGTPGARWLAISAVLVGLVGLLEARMALERGMEQVGFKTAIVLGWTLVLVACGPGLRRDAIPPPRDDSALNNPEQSGAARGY